MKILIAAAQGVTARAATPLAIPLVQIQGKRIGRGLERNDDSLLPCLIIHSLYVCVCVFCSMDPLDKDVNTENKEISKILLL